MIQWEEFGEAAFARAKTEGKPVLLHIGATWCHWCHVMDGDTYPHPGVQAIIAERFVPIRVDTDVRPDVNERYNQGGWPTVAVLDAEGEVLVGRTYVPAVELVMLLSSVSEPGQRWSIAPSLDPVADPSVGLDALWTRVEKAFDRYHGGFGDFQKFPHVGVCEWLLDRRAQGGGDMLVKTLDGMANGELYDHEEGGFFRYATQDDWKDPHYEKLLEDNARLLRLYTRAAVAFGQATWRARAEGVVRWMLATLWGDRSLGGSQDADEAYYSLPRTHRGIPPAVDPTVYAGWNGLAVSALVLAAAAWERPGLASLAADVGESLFIRMDESGRIERTPGGPRGLLSDQAEVAEGWLWLYQRTGDRRWRVAAERALTWARDNLHAAEGGYYDAVPGGVGLLRRGRRPMPANTSFAEACWRLGALTGDDAWLAVARSAADAALDEGEAFGFMAANAAAIRARLDRRAVVVKVFQAPALRGHALCGDAHVLALNLDEAEAERLSVAPGMAMACTKVACARPSTNVGELRAAIDGLA